MDVTKAKNEMNWVIGVVKSVKTKNQLEIALKCFHLWDLKHPSTNDTKSEKSSLKSRFWSVYKNKELEILPTKYS